MNKKVAKKFRLKKLLPGKNAAEKFTNLAGLVGKLGRQSDKNNESASDKGVKEKKPNDPVRTRFKDKVSGSLGRLERIWSKSSDKIRVSDPKVDGAKERSQTGEAIERIAEFIQKRSSSKLNNFGSSSSSLKEKSSIGSLSKKASSSTGQQAKPSDSDLAITPTADEKRLKEFKKSCISLKSARTSSLSSVGKKGKSIFTSDKLSQIEDYLKSLAIDEYLNKIDFVEYDLEIKNYTTSELAEFERNLKKQRVKLDLYLFTFRHFYERIQQDALDAVESIDLISNWATIKDEKIEFWSKLNRSVYMKIEIESGSYDLVIKDEHGNLARFAKESFHHVVKTFATKIANCEHTIKSLNYYMNQINAKKQLTALNLTNLANFRAKKAAQKYLERSKGNV